MKDDIAVREIELKSQYGQWQVVLDNPNANRLTIFMLGDRHRGWMPPPRMLDEFIEALDKALKGDRILVINHPFVSTLQLDLPEGPVLVTTPKPKTKVPANILEEREFLWGIRDAANKKAEVFKLNPDWKRTYESIATAIDHLDAMLARTEEK